MRKGIVLAGGKGSRLYPLTHAVSKQLMPVYNKPMIYYPLQTLKDMDVTEILIIVSNETQRDLFIEQLGDGSHHGLQLQYAIQEKPAGLPDAFIIGESFIGDNEVVLILGDNVFIMNHKLGTPACNTIYTYKVKDPSAYGVAAIDHHGNLLDIVEKPSHFISDNAVVGLYVFSSSAIAIAKELRPSKRGELEIADLINELNICEGVKVKELDGFWFDCGTHIDLLECANLVKAIEQRTNTIIGLH